MSWDEIWWSWSDKRCKQNYEIEWWIMTNSSIIIQVFSDKINFAILWYTGQVDKAQLQQ